MLKINIISLFPDYFKIPLSLSIIGRAQENNLVEFNIVDLRDFAYDKHHQVDDYPYGGGSGMVLKPEPIFAAVDSLLERGQADRDKIIILSAKGRVFNHSKAVELSVQSNLTFICGHYKDIDERVRSHLITDEISIGDFITSSGEIPCLAVIDAVVRLLPGAINDFESAVRDSFFDGLLGPPSFTRPETFREMKVPEVLLSGDHAAIEAWRKKESVRLTKLNRPDLWEKFSSEHGSEEIENSP